MTYRYRCTDRKNCGKSVTLRKKKEHYATEPVCTECGGKINSIHEKERARNKQRTCYCDEYPFPHRKGTEPWCVHAKIGPTDEDYRERYMHGYTPGAGNKYD